MNYKTPETKILNHKTPEIKTLLLLVTHSHLFQRHSCLQGCKRRIWLVRITSILGFIV